MKTVIKLSLTAIFCTFLFSSCLTTKTNIGTYRETAGKEYTYAKGKQFWLFWGIIPIGRTDVNSPADGNCQVVTRFNFVDVLISGLTGGLVSSYTIKIKAKKEVSQ